MGPLKRAVQITVADAKRYKAKRSLMCFVDKKNPLTCDKCPFYIDEKCKSPLQDYKQWIHWYNTFIGGK